MPHENAESSSRPDDQGADERRAHTPCTDPLQQDDALFELLRRVGETAFWFRHLMDPFATLPTRDDMLHWRGKAAGTSVLAAERPCALRIGE
jgi:hypothetical protein